MSLLRMDRQEMIAMMLYLQSWERSDEDMTEFSDDLLEGLIHKWNHEWMPNRFSEHSGDCTKQPWSCLRCQMEEMWKFADRVLDFYKSTREE